MSNNIKNFIIDSSDLSYNYTTTNTNYSFKDTISNSFDIGKCLTNNYYITPVVANTNYTFLIPLINDFRCFIISETFTSSTGTNYRTQHCIVTNTFNIKGNPNAHIKDTTETTDYNTNGPYKISESEYNGPGNRTSFYYNHDTNLLYYKRDDAINLFISVL